MNNKNFSKEHENLLRKWMLNAQLKYPDSRWIKRDIGLFKTLRNTPIKIGIKGQADVYGFVPIGESVLWFEIEFKTLNAKQSKEQKSWQKQVNKMNGIYIIIRDENQFQEIENELRNRMKS